ncbi:hypothetical protein CANINC_004588 [Pichia inconspicua]|uniref:Uncharacterized protein n=1 Tax=Pichia inconspicua TaxID=52247 RepID=A0A4T0WVP5_9ASCO|nr:hypothetical protein CANINC_004588 [[Candida] inconspicua]
MTTREFKTLRQILEYNDRVIQSQLLDDGFEEVANSTSAKKFTLQRTNLLSVLNWNVIFSNNKLFTCMMFMIVTILSQLVFSYVAFALVDVQESISMFYFSQALNLVLSYIMPMALIKDLDDVLENPFAELSKEIELFRQLRNCLIAQSVCCLVSLIALVKVFTSGPFIEMRYNIEQRVDIPLDMTHFVRLLQMISFQLTVINLILAATSFFLTMRKIRYCFNRVERMQSPSDLHAMLNTELNENRYVNNYF